MPTQLKYIPRREYTPGPDIKYRIIFLKDLGIDRDLYYIEINDAEELINGETPHRLRIYRQKKVIREKNKPGLKGVIVMEFKSKSLIEIIRDELQKQEIRGR